MEEHETLSDGDHKLIETADADLEKEHSVFSFDLENFKLRLTNSEDWLKPIIAHLYLEHVLNCFISDLVDEPEKLRPDRTSFSRRLELIEAFNLIPEELSAAIRKISSIRNSVAHDLSFDMNAKVMQQLRNCVPKKLRDAVESYDDRSSSGPAELDELLLVVTLQLEVFRQSYVVRRILERKGRIRLHAVLRKIPHNYVK